MKEAQHYLEMSNKQVQCGLCPHNCQLPVGQNGQCGVRYNRDGQLYTKNYGQVAAIQLDPMEKKPLYHFYPGSKIWSVGTYGCNLFCSFCQNWSLSRGKQGRWQLNPDQLIEQLVTWGDADTDNDTEGSVGVAFTYNEPLIWYEYTLAASKLAKAAGQKVVLITNGYINREPMLELLPYVDAMNIDLKAYTDQFYQEQCGGKLEPVLETIKLVHDKCHLELTTLLIPGLNTDLTQVDGLASWVASLNPSIPLHLSRYYPNYQLDKPPTGEEDMVAARDIAAKSLDYVYLGNMPQMNSNDTFCPRCNRLVIRRQSYHIEVLGLDNKGESRWICSSCGQQINIVC